MTWGIREKYTISMDFCPGELGGRWYPPAAWGTLERGQDLAMRKQKDDAGMG